MSQFSTNAAEQIWAAANAALQAKGRSFYWARHGLGALHGRRVTRLYSFCRMVDDIADTTPSRDLARSTLTAISQSITAGHSSDGRVMDMLDLMAECGIEPLIVQELIAGVMSDLDAVRVNTTDELIHYCHQVAGTVGLMMCHVLDVPSPAARAHAVDLGIAMQLTNICRDVAEDAAAGRRYLPASLIGDISPADLILPRPEDQLKIRQCVATLLYLADRHYQAGERGLAYLPLKARFGILVASRLYRGIGAGLRQRQHDYWAGRMVVGFWQKCWITAGAVLAQLVRPDFWFAPRQNNLSHRGAIKSLDATCHPLGGAGANGR